MEGSVRYLWLHILSFQKQVVCSSGVEGDDTEAGIYFTARSIVFLRGVRSEWREEEIRREGSVTSCPRSTLKPERTVS